MERFLRFSSALAFCSSEWVADCGVGWWRMDFAGSLVAIVSSNLGVAWRCCHELRFAGNRSLWVVHIRRGLCSSGFYNLARTSRCLVHESFNQFKLSGSLIIRRRFRHSRTRRSAAHLLPTISLQASTRLGQPHSFEICFPASFHCLCVICLGVSQLTSICRI